MTTAQKLANYFKNSNSKSIDSILTFCNLYKDVKVEKLSFPMWAGDGTMWIFPDNSCIFSLKDKFEEVHHNKTVVTTSFANKTPKTAKRFTAHLMFKSEK